MAISTYKTFLMKKASAGATWEKVIDIKDFPDLGGSPELLDTTTLSNKNKTNILGIQDLGSLEFTCNYTLEDYKKLKALNVKEEEYAVWFGGTEGPLKPTGSEGKFMFKGTLDVCVLGAGVNAVVDMKVTIACSSDITLDETVTG